MHRCYVPTIREPAVVLEGSEAHHVARVLRLGPGATLAVFDGRGREWTGVVDAVGRSTVTVSALVPRRPVPEPAVAITLGVGVLKGDQMGTVIRDAVMLGAAAIVPIASAHTARPVRAGQLSDRWQRVALSSARQCGRAVVPPVHPVARLEDLLAEPVDVRVLCVEPSAAGAPAGPVPRPRATALLLVGPEGGWSQDELAQAGAATTHRLDLGPRTLRAETAPTVALASLWTAWGWA